MHLIYPSPKQYSPTLHISRHYSPFHKKLSNLLHFFFSFTLSLSLSKTILSKPPPKHQHQSLSASNEKHVHPHDEKYKLLVNFKQIFSNKNPWLENPCLFYQTGRFDHGFSNSWQKLNFRFFVFKKWTGNNSWSTWFDQSVRFGFHTMLITQSLVLV